jgi:tetratricopeptide (TPR) repeat protein
MTFATRSKFFWSRFIATCVKYLGVANTQQIRFIAEKILPTDMSRQNILYHVRIAEEKGWIATFASALEMTEDNELLFRRNFLSRTKEKISAQRFVIIGTEGFEPAAEDKIKAVCKDANLEPISILQHNVLELITEDSIQRLTSTKEKAAGNKSLFMVLLRFGWFWVNINPEKSLRIIEVLKNNISKHNFNEHYKIDVDLLSIVSMIELETTPEIDLEEFRSYLSECAKLSSTGKRSDIMNLMSMTLLISGRYLVAYNKLFLAEEYLNRGIKYLRFSKRKSILMRKLHVDGLFDLGFIYSQQGWFYKALGIYENIERIIVEEFQKSEPTDNLNGRLALAKAELYLMMAFPSYTFQDEDYRTSLLKSIKFAREAYRFYQVSKNQLKLTEIDLLSAWINALIGRIKRAEQLLKRGTKELIAPVPPKLNALYYNTQAELFRKQGMYPDAIKNISQSFDYMKILGQNIGKLFSMTRLSELHVQLSNSENRFSFISFGDVTHLFEKEVSDMISHVFLENNRLLVEHSAIVSFFVSEDALENHPEINTYVEFLPAENISPVLLGESFTILPNHIINHEGLSKGKSICIVGSKRTTGIRDEFDYRNFEEEMTKFDDIFQKLLSKA